MAYPKSKFRFDVEINTFYKTTSLAAIDMFEFGEEYMAVGFQSKPSGSKLRN